MGGPQPRPIRIVMNRILLIYLTVCTLWRFTTAQYQEDWYDSVPVGRLDDGDYLNTGKYQAVAPLPVGPQEKCAASRGLVRFPQLMNSNCSAANQAPRDHCMSDKDCYAGSFCCLSVCDGVTKCFNPATNEFTSVLPVSASSREQQPAVEIRQNVLRPVIYSVHLSHEAPHKDGNRMKSARLGMKATNSHEIGATIEELLGISGMEHQKLPESNGKLQEKQSNQIAPVTKSHSSQYHKEHRTKKVKPAKLQEVKSRSMAHEGDQLLSNVHNIQHSHNTTSHLSHLSHTHNYTNSAIHITSKAQNTTSLGNHSFLIPTQNPGHVTKTKNSAHGSTQFIHFSTTERSFNPTHPHHTTHYFNKPLHHPTVPLHQHPLIPHQTGQYSSRPDTSSDHHLSSSNHSVYSSSSSLQHPMLHLNNSASFVNNSASQSVHHLNSSGHLERDSVHQFGSKVHVQNHSAHQENHSSISIPPYKHSNIHDNLDSSSTHSTPHYTHANVHLHNDHHPIVFHHTTDSPAHPEYHMAHNNTIEYKKNPTINHENIQPHPTPAEHSHPTQSLHTQTQPHNISKVTSDVENARDVQGESDSDETTPEINFGSKSNLTPGTQLNGPVKSDHHTTHSPAHHEYHMAHNNTIEHNKPPTTNHEKIQAQDSEEESDSDETTPQANFRSESNFTQSTGKSGLYGADSEKPIKSDNNSRSLGGISVDGPLKSIDSSEQTKINKDTDTNATNEGLSSSEEEIIGHKMMDTHSLFIGDLFDDGVEEQRIAHNKSRVRSMNGSVASHGKSLPTPVAQWLTTQSRIFTIPRTLSDTKKVVPDLSASKPTVKPLNLPQNSSSSSKEYNRGRIAQPSMQSRTLHSPGTNKLAHHSLPKQAVQHPVGLKMGNRALSDGSEHHEVWTTRNPSLSTNKHEQFSVKNDKAHLGNPSRSTNLDWRHGLTYSRPVTSTVFPNRYQTTIKQSTSKLGHHNLISNVSTSPEPIHYQSSKSIVMATTGEYTEPDTSTSKNATHDSVIQSLVHAKDGSARSMHEEAETVKDTNLKGIGHEITVVTPLPHHATPVARNEFPTNIIFVTSVINTEAPPRTEGFSSHVQQGHEPIMAAMATIYNVNDTMNSLLLTEKHSNSTAANKSTSEDTTKSYVMEVSQSQQNNLNTGTTASETSPYPSILVPNKEIASTMASMKDSSQSSKSDAVVTSGFNRPTTVHSVERITEKNEFATQIPLIQSVDDTVPRFSSAAAVETTRSGVTSLNYNSEPDSKENFTFGKYLGAMKDRSLVAHDNDGDLVRNHSSSMPFTSFHTDGNSTMGTNPTSIFTTDSVHPTTAIPITESSDHKVQEKLNAVTILPESISTLKPQGSPTLNTLISSADLTHETAIGSGKKLVESDALEDTSPYHRSEAETASTLFLNAAAMTTNAARELSQSLKRKEDQRDDDDTDEPGLKYSPANKASKQDNLQTTAFTSERSAESPGHNFRGSSSIPLTSSGVKNIPEEAQTGTSSVLNTNVINITDADTVYGVRQSQTADRTVLSLKTEIKDLEKHSEEQGNSSSTSALPTTIVTTIDDALGTTQKFIPVQGRGVVVVEDLGEHTQSTLNDHINSISDGSTVPSSNTYKLSTEIGKDTTSSAQFKSAQQQSFNQDSIIEETTRNFDQENPEKQIKPLGSRMKENSRSFVSHDHSSEAELPVHFPVNGDDARGTSHGTSQPISESGSAQQINLSTLISEANNKLSKTTERVQDDKQRTDHIEWQTEHVQGAMTTPSNVASASSHSPIAMTPLSSQDSRHPSITTAKATPYEQTITLAAPSTTERTLESVNDEHLGLGIKQQISLVNGERSLNGPLDHHEYSINANENHQSLSAATYAFDDKESQATKYSSVSHMAPAVAENVTAERAQTTKDSTGALTLPILPNNTEVQSTSKGFFQTTSSSASKYEKRTTVAQESTVTDAPQRSSVLEGTSPAIETDISSQLKLHGRKQQDGVKEDRSILPPEDQVDSILSVSQTESTLTPSRINSVENSAHIPARSSLSSTTDINKQGQIPSDMVKYTTFSVATKPSVTNSDSTKSVNELVSTSAIPSSVPTRGMVSISVELESQNNATGMRSEITALPVATFSNPEENSKAPTTEPAIPDSLLVLSPYGRSLDSPDEHSQHTTFQVFTTSNAPQSYPKSPSATPNLSTASPEAFQVVNSTVNNTRTVGIQHDRHSNESSQAATAGNLDVSGPTESVQAQPTTTVLQFLAQFSLDSALEVDPEKLIEESRRKTNTATSESVRQVTSGSALEVDPEALMEESRRKPINAGPDYSTQFTNTPALEIDPEVLMEEAGRDFINTASDYLVKNTTDSAPEDSDASMEEFIKNTINQSIEASKKANTVSTILGQTNNMTDLSLASALTGDGNLEDGTENTNSSDISLKNAQSEVDQFSGYSMPIDSDVNPQNESGAVIEITTIKNEQLSTDANNMDSSAQHGITHAGVTNSTASTNADSNYNHNHEDASQQPIEIPNEDHEQQPVAAENPNSHHRPPRHDIANRPSELALSNIHNVRVINNHGRHKVPHHHHGLLATHLGDALAIHPAGAGHHEVSRKAAAGGLRPSEHNERKFTPFVKAENVLPRTAEHQEERIAFTERETKSILQTSTVAAVPNVDLDEGTNFIDNNLPPNTEDNH